MGNPAGSQRPKERAHQVHGSSRDQASSPLCSSPHLTLSAALEWGAGTISVLQPAFFLESLPTPSGLCSFPSSAALSALPGSARFPPLAPGLPADLSFPVAVITSGQEPRGARVRAVLAVSHFPVVQLWHRVGSVRSLCRPRLPLCADQLPGSRDPHLLTCGSEASLPEAPGDNQLWTEITVRSRENSSQWDGKLIFLNFNQHFHENYL